MRHTFTLSQKLLTLALIGIVPTVLAGAVGYRGLSQTSEAALRLDRAVAIQRSQMHADMMHDNLRGMGAQASVAVQNGNEAARKEVEKEALEAGATMLSEIDTVRINSEDSTVRALATKVRPIVEHYIAVAAKLTTVAGKQDSSSKALAADVEATFHTLEHDQDVLADRVGESSKEMSTGAQLVAQRVKLQLIVLCVIALLAVGFSARAIIKAIRAPIAQMAEHAHAISLGNFSRDMSYESKDEIGSLAESFRAVTTFVKETASATHALAQGDLTHSLTARSADDVLAHSVNDSADTLRRLDSEIRRLVDAARAGNLTVRASSASFAGAYRELVDGINDMLDETLAPVTEATTVLGQVADRNLRVRVHGAYRGDHARLTVALNSTLDQLESALRDVHIASEEVSSAADQISASSSSMADGASAQASTLEEINASLQELDTLSATSAREASAVKQLTVSARATADEGLTHMARLNEAMDAIHSSVGETARIMRTIDEIAFQTNLLALNAAVEAARAGDAGRGFAVVADEGRALALRSAEEAKRSASVIERSQQDAARGVEIKELTQRQLSEIASTVSKVSDAMQSIAERSEQQAEGLRQILDGTEHMNQTTQQAAATAEETAAAAQELTSQAESLHTLVGQFELSSTHARGSSASKSPARRTRGRVLVGN
jgi:methyl-accepting chemotaxis protein